MSVGLSAIHPAYIEQYCTAQYNVRAAVPEHAAIFARWAKAAKAYRQVAGAQIDLAYGPSAGERLDLFPAADRLAPLLVFIHGGWWRSMDKSDFSWLAAPYNKQGVAVAVINYDLVPAVTMETIVRQNLRASDWLWRHASRLGFDRHRMVVAGHSAGGHLAAMLMCAKWGEWASDLPSTLYRTALSLSGIFDLEPLMYATHLNGDLKLTPERCATMSPLFMQPASAAPVYTVVGGLESDEFKRQSAALATAWGDVHRETIPAEGENHFTLCDRMADPEHAVFQTALRICQQAAPA